MMTTPNATFSQAAAQALNLAITSNNAVTTGLNAAQVIDPKPVPEPTTVVCWLAGLSAAFLIRRKSRHCRLSLIVTASVTHDGSSPSGSCSLGMKAQLRRLIGRDAEAEFLAGLEGSFELEVLVGDTAGNRGETRPSRSGGH